MNPALDITTGTEVVRPTNKLRCAAARHDPGGGGINVARVAGALGAKSVAVFPAGGPAGEVVNSLLATEGIAVQRVTIDGWTRESFTVNESSTADQYRFVLPGPELTAAEADASTGDLRKVIWALMQQIWTWWNGTASADRPAKVTVSKSSSTNTETGVVTNTFVVVCYTSVSAQEVVAES
jgi:sugar/nucleoside kinase (ribokinase family)